MIYGLHIHVYMRKYVVYLIFKNSITHKIFNNNTLYIKISLRYDNALQDPFTTGLIHIHLPL
jgi:hypothetical protein